MEFNIRELYSQSLKIARSLLAKWGASIEEEELTSIVNLSLAEALNRYDPSKGAAIITFLYYHLKGNLVKHIEEKKVCQEFISEQIEIDYFSRGETNVTVSEKVNPEEIFEEKEANQNFYRALDTLTELEKQLLILNLEYGYKVQHIAKKLGLSRSYLSKLKYAALKKVCMHLGFELDLPEILKNTISSTSSEVRRKQKRSRVRKSKKFTGVKKIANYKI